VAPHSAPVRRTQSVDVLLPKRLQRRPLTAQDEMRRRGRVGDGRTLFAEKPRVGAEQAQISPECEARRIKLFRGYHHWADAKERNEVTLAEERKRIRKVCLGSTAKELLADEIPVKLQGKLHTAELEMVAQLALKRAREELVMDCQYCNFSLNQQTRCQRHSNISEFYRRLIAEGQTLEEILNGDMPHRTDDEEEEARREEQIKEALRQKQAEELEVYRSHRRRVKEAEALEKHAMSSCSKEQLFDEMLELPTLEHPSDVPGECLKKARLMAKAHLQHQAVRWCPRCIFWEGGSKRCRIHNDEWLQNLKEEAGRAAISGPKTQIKVISKTDDDTAVQEDHS